MRILIPSIQVPFITGGATLMTNGLKEALIQQGHEVEIVTLPFKFYPESYINDLIDFWKKQDFNEFNGYKIDLVIALQFPAYYIKHNNKVLWLMHQHRAVYELYNNEDNNINLKQLREKIILNDSNELTKIKKRYSMCQNVSNRLYKNNNIKATPLYHPPANEDKFYTKDSYNYVFYPSRLETLKRQDLLIKAMQYTKTNVKAIIAGVGGQYDAYNKLIKELNIEDKVKLIGYISDEEKYAYYSRALAVVFTPYDEDYGYISLEAMLSSKPIITCEDSGGPLEFVENKETGFIVKPEPKEIAKKIDWLYKNREKAKNMGQKGLEHYKSKNISWNSVVTTLLGDKL